MPTSPHAKAIRTAIDRNSSLDLGVALLAARQDHDSSWKTETIGGYTCWSRVLANRTRAHLLTPLLMAGVSLASPIAFAGKQRWPLDVMVRRGNWALMKSVLSKSVDLGPSNAIPGLLWTLTKRWFSSSRTFHQNQALGSRAERERIEKEHKAQDRQEWAATMRALKKRGYLPCPRLLSFWMLHLDGSLAESERLDWVEEAWRQGVRPCPSVVHSYRNLPKAYPTGAAQVRPVVVLLLKTLSPQEAERVMPLVTQALAEIPPTPGWMAALISGWDSLLSGNYVGVYSFNTRSQEECEQYLRRFDGLVHCIQQAWPEHRWTLEDWGDEEKQTWFQTVEGHRNRGWNLQVAPQTRWALQHGLPLSHVLLKHGSEIFKVTMEATQHRMTALTDLFEAGLRMETVVSSEGLTFGKWLADPKRGNVLSDPETDTIVSKYRQHDLEQALPPARSAAQRIRF